MFRYALSRENAEPFTEIEIVKCLNQYIERFKKRPNILFVSDRLTIEDVFGITIEQTPTLYPYQIHIAHTEDTVSGINIGEGSDYVFELPKNYTSKSTTSPLEKKKVKKAIPVSKRIKKRKSKPVVAFVNGLPSMEFSTRQDGAEYFQISVNSINLNLSQPESSGGVIRSNGNKIKLTWEHGKE